MRQFAIIVALLLCTGLTAKAGVEGKVFNEQKEPVIGASAVLLALPDSTYVDGATTSDDGSFSLAADVVTGAYLLKVQAFGYEQAEVGIDASTPRPLDIMLKMATTELNEVVVRGKAPVTTREGGKFIFIPNALADDMASARNLMDYVPLVEWTDHGVSILGKGASKIYLNGKDPHWNPIEVTSLLQTLDPHYIKRVEIITDPGAVTDAAFMGGIVNIIYDDPTQGFRGNARVNAGLNNDNPSAWPNLWLNYQKNRFKASLNLEYYYSHSFNHTSDVYDYKDAGRSVFNDTKTTSFSNAVRGKLNVSYDLTPRSVVGATVTLGTTRMHSKTEVSTLTKHDDGREENSTMSQTQDSHPDKPDIFALGYYTLNLDEKGSMVDIVAAYGGTASHSDFNNLFSGLAKPQLFENDYYAFSGKAGFTKVFNPTTQFEAGFLFVDAHSQNKQTYDNVFDNFKYYERQLNAYVQFNKRWNNSLSTNVGLRVENTHTLGRQLQDASNDTQDYTDLFPSLAVSWNIPQGNQALSLSYDRRISRPGSMMLNPYRIWSSDNTYSQGNPHLRPEYTDAVGLTYSFLSKFIFSSRYYYTSQLTSQYTMSTPEGLTETSFTNSGRTNYFAMTFSFETLAWNFWRLDAAASARYENMKTNAQGHGIHSSEWTFSLHQSNRFFISRRNQIMASFSHGLSSPSNGGLFKTSWRYNISAGIQKSFRFGLDLSLYANLPVTGYDNREFEQPYYSYRHDVHDHMYSVNLTMSYSFGKSRVQGAPDRSKDLNLGL